LWNCDFLSAASASKTSDLSQAVTLQHDIATLHSTSDTKVVAVDFCWELLDRPPYGPDLPALDYNLFGLPKQQLGGWWFDNNKEVETGVQE
jgi:hypothetical protein